jgi:hypothetical protein
MIRTKEEKIKKAIAEGKDDPKGGESGRKRRRR